MQGGEGVARFRVGVQGMPDQGLEVFDQGKAALQGSACANDGYRTPDVKLLRRLSHETV